MRSLLLHLSRKPPFLTHLTAFWRGPELPGPPARLQKKAKTISEGRRFVNVAQKTQPVPSVHDFSTLLELIVEAFRTG